MKMITAIVEQHAESAAFLWLLRDRSVWAPHITLDDLAALDERVEAHLDGLRLAGDEGWDVCQTVLAHEEPGEIFARSLLAHESGRADRIDGILAVAAEKPDLSRACVASLGWLPLDTARRHIGRYIASESAALRRIGIAAAAVHRLDPGAVLETSLESGDDPALTSRALRAVGELGLRALLPAVRPHLEAEDDDVRFAAAWSAGLLGDASAVAVLGEFAAEGGPYAERACGVGLRCLPSGDAYRAHQELADRPALARLAVIAAGVIGDPALAGWLLSEMAVPARARVAGEAFALITGANIAHPALEGEPPEGSEALDAGPTDDPEDEHVALDPDEHLPWPDRDKLEQWWFDYRSEFRAGTRYVLGNPITIEWMWEVIATGRQRQRAAAALELGMTSRGPLFEVRAPGFRQRAALAAGERPRS